MFLASSTSCTLSLCKAGPTITENSLQEKKNNYIYASQSVFLNTKRKGKGEKNYMLSGSKKRLRNEKASYSWMKGKVPGRKQSADK